ncbi:response regulator transcription factor [Phenylobacterium sp.]|uniref:response regulator n=1 Tax=Phenylobacterium sp. TaxID=1871053 RepID=UPI0027378839|nr:response regulator transcription factor [Phenylobacterium sp.]MDP3869466.1 response regulator transcription factor [Phenylobacterium sp.]
MSLRILFADDHALVLDSIAALLSIEDPDLEVARAADFDAAMIALRDQGPFDLVILDLNMPGMNGSNGIREVHARFEGLPIIVMSGSAKPAEIVAVMDAGAKSFLPKTMASRVLLNVIRIVAAGETFVPAEIAKQIQMHRDGAGFELFTARELDVLGHLRNGDSNKEIARQLDIQETTVKRHMQTIAEKLSARNRTEIIIRAFEMGLF